MKKPLKRALLSVFIIIAVFILCVFIFGDAFAWAIALTFATGIGTIVFAIYDSKSN